HVSRLVIPLTYSSLVLTSRRFALSGRWAATFLYHPSSSSMVTTRLHLRAQKSVEFPQPYSNTLLSDRSICLRNSTAGYVNQGMGWSSLSIASLRRMVLNWPYSTLKILKLCNDHHTGRVINSINSLLNTGHSLCSKGEF